MALFLNPQVAQHYRSLSQKARAMTEAWLAENGYCANCGAAIQSCDNNDHGVIEFIGRGQYRVVKGFQAA
ncbi:MAG: DpnI domain-containing protein [Neisseria sp.]|nr:DpnI domain-containing protein [Neisseria sp.]